MNNFDNYSNMTNMTNDFPSETTNDVVDNLPHAARIYSSLDYYDALWADNDAPHATIDTRGNILSANNAFEDLTGYSQAELFEMNYSDIAVHDADLRNDLINVNAMIKGKAHSFRNKQTLKKKDHKLIPVRLIAKRIPYGDLAAPMAYYIVIMRQTHPAISVVEDKHGILRPSSWEVIKAFRWQIFAVALCFVGLAYLTGNGSLLIEGIVKIIMALRGVG